MNMMMYSVENLCCFEMSKKSTLIRLAIILISTNWLAKHSSSIRCGECVIDFVKANKNSGKLVERDERQLTKRCQWTKKKKESTERNRRESKKRTDDFVWKTTNEINIQIDLSWVCWCSVSFFFLQSVEMSNIHYDGRKFYLIIFFIPIFFSIHHKFFFFYMRYWIVFCLFI